MSIDYEEEGFKFARRRFEDGRKQGAVEELELDISWLKDLEDYAYLFGHKGEMLNRITMRKEYQNKRLEELKKGV
jgi:hypothetical protein